MVDHEAYLERYLAEVGKVERPTPERERELRERARSGDREALREVVWSYLEFAHALAQELKPDWMAALTATEEANQLLAQVIRSDVEDVQPALEERLRIAFERFEPAGPDAT